MLTKNLKLAFIILVLILILLSLFFVVTCKKEESVKTGIYLECPKAEIIPDLHDDEDLLEQALEESDRRICYVIHNHPNDKISVVISFSKLLSEEEVKTIVNRYDLVPFMLDSRHGSGRMRIQVVDSLEGALEKRKNMARSSLPSMEEMTNQIINDAHQGLNNTDEEEIKRLELELKTLKDTEPTYLALGVYVAASKITELTYDNYINYVVATSMYGDDPRGIDPETGYWK
ncbi:MAG: hypothetical protein PHD51_00865 [Patescibacteria group bacterium]|nr:hypothetical protein [Patescibacteria group bacterium]MDD5490586.1 hypothetical protein [Patescibacteria group bacterium]